MFDHNLFDKNGFDSNVPDSSDPIFYSYGGMRVNFLIESPLTIIFDGNSDLNSSFDLCTTLDISIYASSDFSVIGIGDTVLLVIHLENITLLPNEEITIDTDLLTVLFGSEYDVSSITNDSKFFELGPGRNILSFYAEFEGVPPLPAFDNELDVTVIWENRWL